MKRRSERGLTLIEILVALFVLTVILLAVSSMVYSVLRSTAQSKEVTTATTLMQDKMEALKHASLTSLTSGSDSVLLGNINYLRQWVVSSVANVRTITVTVNWANRGSHSVSMTTLRGD